jgi:hypothetical protein
VTELISCPDCGHHVSPRASTCPSCGNPLDAGRVPAEPRQLAPSSPRVAATCSRALFAFAVTCFLFPFVTISCDRTRVATLSGSELSVGTTVSTRNISGAQETQRLPPEPLMALVLAGGIAAFVVASVRGGAALAAVIGGASAAAGLVFKSRLDGQVAAQGLPLLHVDYEPAFWATLASLAIGGATSLYAAFERDDRAPEVVLRVTTGIGAVAILCTVGISGLSLAKFIEAGNKAQSVPAPPPQTTSPPTSLRESRPSASRSTRREGPINVSLSPRPSSLAIAPGDKADVVWEFRNASASAVSITSRRGTYRTSDGEVLSSPVGPYSNNIFIPGHASATWTDNVYLPPNIADTASARGSEVVELFEEFEGKSVDGQRVSCSAVLHITR